MAMQKSTASARAGERSRSGKSQLGPVTRAIRELRPNELPSWEMRERQMEEERKALRDLRKRIADQIEADIALLDAIDGDADLEDEPAEEQHDAENTGWRMLGGHAA